MVIRYAVCQWKGDPSVFVLAAARRANPVDMIKPRVTDCTGYAAGGRAFLASAYCRCAPVSSKDR
jgi:hypothetical protein